MGREDFAAHVLQALRRARVQPWLSGAGRRRLLQRQSCSHGRGARDAGDDPGALLRWPPRRLDGDAAVHGILIEPSTFFFSLTGCCQPTGSRASTVSDGLMYERSRGSHASDWLVTLRSSLRKTAIDSCSSSSQSIASRSIVSCESSTVWRSAGKKIASFIAALRLP